MNKIAKMLVLERPKSNNEFAIKYAGKPLFGWGNGYVIINNKHPLFGKHWSDPEIRNLNVHGGITFAEPINEFNGWNQLKRLPARFKARKDLWVLGFDTAHYNDNPNNWNKQKVYEETKFLQQQLLKMYKKIEVFGLI